MFGAGAERRVTYLFPLVVFLIQTPSRFETEALG